MTKTDSTKVMWQVQVRKSRLHKWTSKGRFETRGSARRAAYCLRVWGRSAWGSAHDGFTQGYGFGNTRVERVVKGVA